MKTTKTLFALAHKADNDVAMLQSTMNALHLWFSDYASELDELMSAAGSQDQALTLAATLAMRGQGSVSMLNLICENLDRCLGDLDQQVQALFAELRRQKDAESSAEKQS